jgi:ribonuclease R
MPRSNDGQGTPPAPKKRITGIIQVTRKGVGYLPWPLAEGVVFVKGAPKEQEDIEFDVRDLAGALNGDEVEAELRGLIQPRTFRGQAPKAARMSGKVIRVVSRAKTEFVATIKNGAAIAADQKLYRPFTLTAPAEEGSKVIIKLVSFDGIKDPVGEVIEVIGKAGDHRTEMNAIVMEKGFRTDFPAEAEAEADSYEKRHLEIIAEELPKRADYRDLVVMTIDPKDAKDFDDALSIRELPDGTFEVGVHIADASYYCAPGTAVDKEARNRGTSVYLVDATIPMLPHQISGGVASLKADEDRLAFSAMFILDKNARVVSRTFTKSVIRSKKRFTYEDAQEVLDKQAGPYLMELNQLFALAKVMRAERQAQGAIDFGDNEVRFELDEVTGVPLRVVRKVRIDTNWLIEEFMLLANREVAMYVSKLAADAPAKRYAFLYRIHDEPKADRIAELQTFVRAIGYEFGRPKHKINAKDIQSLLEHIKGKPEEHLIRTATLRSMAKAIYTTRNIGHFGLAFEYYTHFTSPIRRYPDMLVHRILASHLGGAPISSEEYESLERMCILASEQEAKAVDAERESIRYKQVEYLMGRIGETFEGVISGVTDWGLYVEEKESAAEGLVRVRSIGDDFYNYSQKDYALVGERNKQKYTLGDTVKVKLIAADLAARTLDFELVR